MAERTDHNSEPDSPAQPDSAPVPLLARLAKLRADLAADLAEGITIPPDGAA